MNMAAAAPRRIMRKLLRTIPLAPRPLVWWLLFEGAAISMLIAAGVVNILWDFFDPRLRPLQRIKLHVWMPWWFRL